MFCNLETFWQDAWHGARMLGRNPGFAAAATLTLALGIGASTTIFSVVKFRAAEAPAFLGIRSGWPSFGKPAGSTGRQFPLFPPRTSLIGRIRPEFFEQLAAWRFLYFNLSGRDQPERVQGLTLSASFLPLLGA